VDEVALTVPPSRTTRRAYIDWARGLAVLVMIEAHAIDAWTRPADKGSAAYAVAVILGGFAAPLFLWLAGLGVAMAAARTAVRTGSRRAAVEAAVTRGLEIYILAFLFRAQAFVVSPPSTPLKLFRVDILNVMGPAMAIVGLLWGISASVRVRLSVYAAVATAFAMATPLIRASPLVDALPVWFQWYVRPAGEFTTFTLFPWAGFVFAGAAAGDLLARVSSASERRLNVGIVAAGLALVVLGFFFAAQPSIYRSSSFWTSSPTWFAIRVGAMMVVLALCFGLEQVVGNQSAALQVLAKIGRSSLFIYWIHVELVYGYASWLWRGRLPFWAAVVGYGVFCALMYGAVLLRDWVVANWRRIPRVRTPRAAQGVP
jgi:uncharacterized membrane protein